MLSRTARLMRFFSRSTPLGTKIKLNKKIPKEENFTSEEPILEKDESEMTDDDFNKFILKYRNETRENTIDEYLTKQTIREINFLSEWMKKWEKNEHHSDNDGFNEKMKSFAFQPFVLLIDMIIYYLIFTYLFDILRKHFLKEYEYWFDKDVDLDSGKFKILRFYKK